MPKRYVVLIALVAATLAQPASADPAMSAPPNGPASAMPSASSSAAPGNASSLASSAAPLVAPPLTMSFLERATSGATGLVDSALAFLGVSYRFGGNTPESGFDCSGLVRRVFRDAIGLNLPRTAKEMAQVGTQVRMEDLKPGDLVFFNTMRHAFSHVGIYLGDNKFVHAPSTGGVVRVEDMRIPYWMHRFNGARRVSEDGTSK